MRALPILLLGVAGAALAEPIPYTATYKVNLDNRLNGTATATLSRQGNRYHYELRAAAMMANSLEQTDFLMENGQIKSLGYQNQRQVFFRSRANRVAFDWKKLSAHAVRNGKEKDYAIKPGALDPLNMDIQIREDLLRTGKLDGVYLLADPKEFHPVRFEIMGGETLNTPMGALDTLRVRRIHASPDRDSQFWLAKSLGYLTVKVVQNDDGAVFKLDLTGYQPVIKPAPSATSPAASLPAAKPPAAL